MRTAAIAVLALTACSVPAPPLGTPSTDSILEAPPARAAALRIDDAPPVPDRERFGKRGRFRVVHKSACDAWSTYARGNPLVWPDQDTPPTAGEPLRVLWTTTPSSPYMDVVAAYLLVSFGDVKPVELPPEIGYPGCTLHVDPNPRNLFVLTPSPGSVLTMDGGRIWLHWPPPDAFAGHEVNCQLMVHAADANAGGWLFSPGLEMWIGSGR